MEGEVGGGPRRSHVGGGRGLASLPFVLAGACAEGGTRGLGRGARPSLRLRRLRGRGGGCFGGVTEAEPAVLGVALVFFLRSRPAWRGRGVDGGGEPRALLRGVV